MAKVLDFEQYKEDKEAYQDRLDETLEWLDEVAEELLTRCVNLAVADKWKEWDQGIPVGAVFDFDPQALSESGDENIAAMMRVWTAIREIVPEEEDG